MNTNMVLSLSSQIGFLLHNLNDANYRSVAYQLTRFTGYGLDGSIVLLQSCLDQVNLRDGDVQNMQLKLELLSVVVKYLVHQSNFSTVFCQAVRNTHMTEDILGDLSKALHLSLPEQVGLGFALADSDDINRSQEGQNFCEAKIMDLYQNPTAGGSEDLIKKILLFLHQTERLSKHVASFLEALSLLAPKAQMSLLLTPLFKNDVNAVNTLRSFQFCAYNSQVLDDVLMQMEEATDVASIMEELGYGCTIDVAHCKDILSLFCPLTEQTVSKIISTVVRTHTGLVDAHGTHGTFYSSLFYSSTTDCSWLSSWNIDVLLDSIKELAPEIKWVSVMEALDHEGFYLPDQQSFSMLMSTYAKTCQDAFPVQTVCGSVWKNDDGQLSFLRFAVSASPEMFTFANSRRRQVPLEGPHGNKLPYGFMNQAWLSVDLVEVLCHLAEMGHGAVVRSMFEYPINHCPETLLVVVAQVQTTFNMLQYEIFSTLFPLYLGGNLNSSIVLSQLWHVNPNMVLWSMMDIHSKDPNSISRIADACQEIKALALVLDMTPLSFAIELAAFASRREYLDLESWLNDNLITHRDTLFEACLKFLRERTLFEASNDALGTPVPNSGPIVNLSLDTTASFFKVLQCNVGQLESQDLVEEMKRLHSAMVRVNPRLLSVGAAEQSPSEAFAADIDEESNSYFQKIYVGQLTIDALVHMLACFKESSEKREQEIFACMIQSLFDEYRFFPRYPERELRMTGILFGSIIKHQIVSSLTLGIALRCVLDALRKPLDSKMFSFGFTALEQFIDRLVEWPQYCNHILQISHVRDAHGELIEFIDRALARSSSSHPEPTVGNPLPTDQHQSLLSLTASDANENSDATWQSIVGPATPQSVLAHRQQGILASYVRQPSLAVTGPTISVNGQIDSGLGLKSSQAAPSQLAGSGSTTSMVSSQGFLCNSRGSTIPATRQTLNSFGHALNIETLVAAAEKRDTAIEAPGSEVQDKIAFMINNISTTNLEAKSKEFSEILKDQYYPWFAQYMVMKRASIEPNFHDLYLKFLDKINSKALHKEIIKATYENCKVLLKSELIKSSSEERSLLKNLGSWLGKLTIGRNQALRAREIDPKLLIIEAYEKGLMIAVIPFTSKILEPCQSSLAYQPPNPWTMGILSLLAEIYALPNLKMNLRFDIEVLFKNLGVETKDVKPTQLLKGRAREIEGNPDFSNKDLGVAQQAGTEHTTGTVSSNSQVELQPEVSASHPGASHPPVVPQFSAALHLSSSTGGEDEKVSTLPAMSDRMSAGLGLPHASPAQSPFPVSQISIPISNIGAYVVVNQKLNALGQQLQFQRIVPVAMERAIREIISPVVERSVTIACMTSRELVTKDYAMESEESRIRDSANKMVASLAGSLAHVTCKEPLRVAMANHLRSLLQQLNVAGEVLEQAVQLVTNDNLDLGCAVIEQAATEKALRDLEDVIGHALAVRRKQRETLGPAFYDATVYSQNLARLPEALRPKPGRLSPAQQRVYEDFARLPWQNQPTQSTPVAPSVSSSSNAGSIGSAFSRVVYGSASAHASSSGYSATQSTSVLGVIAQPLEHSSEELDSCAASPHSQIVMADGGLRQVPDVLSVSCSLITDSSAIAEGNSLESSSSIKESGPIVQPSTPTSSVERLGSTGLEPSLSTGEVLDKYQLLSQKVEAAISKDANEQEVQGIVSEIPEIILQCISRDEAALAIAQKVFKRLYENASNNLHVSTHITILAIIREVCKRVVKELTSWVIYSDEDRKFNKDITVGLIRSELINLTEYNMHLAKLVDGGRNASATEFAIFLVQTCVVQEPGISASELYNLIEALGKVAQRPGSPESLQQLIEDVKNTSLNVASQTASAVGKEEKARQSRDKKATLGRAGTNRDDSKLVGRDGGLADPPGFREQVAETRFASHTIVLRRLVKVRQALMRMVTSNLCSIWRQSNTERAQKVKSMILDDPWWDRVDYLLSFTEPIMSMIRFIDMDQSFLGEIYDGIDSMIEKIKFVINAKEQDPEETFFKQVQSILIKRWNKMTTPLHLLAFALTPRFYSAEILSLPGRVAPYRDEEVSERYMAALDRLFPDPEAQDIVMVEFDNFIAETGHSLLALQNKYKMDAHMWWYLHGHASVYLQSLAIKVLAHVALLFDDWAHICDSPGVNDKACAVYMSQLQQTGMLKGDDVSDRFFRVLTELAVAYCLASEVSVPSSISLSSQQIMQGLSFTTIDMYTKLVVLLVKYCAVDSGMTKVNLLNKVLAVTVRVIQKDAEEKKSAFHPRPYFRLFVNWLMDFNSPDPALDASNFQVLTAFANAFHSLQPLRIPGWSFAWLELICHRSFMPKLLLSNNQKGWPFFQRLLVDLFKFMEPYLRNAELSDPVRLLYKGTLRVLLVLLHDFSEFLCDYHFSFCDVIPPSCIQMRNLILSAFPRNMRLPDPFTPNLKVDLLPEISQSPRILSEVDAALKARQIKTEVDEYLKTRQPMSMLIVDMKNRVLLPQHEAVSAGTRYNVPLINSLVLYVGMQQLQSKSTPQQLAVPTAPIHSAPMDIFQRLILDLDTEGRYLFLNAVANQLRYPNNHTHYFSCVLLYLFAEANQEMIQEQITRVLLERLIVNRPHPWGLLITFIELIKNPRYDFWNRGFTRCAPEIEKLFESVARSCMGPTLKPVEGDISSSLSTESHH